MKTAIAWDSPVQFLKSVGPIRARALARLGIHTAGDLLLHFPRRYFDRSRTTSVRRLVVGEEQTVEGTIMTAGERRLRRGGSLQAITVSDGTGTLYCVWFNQSFLLRQLRPGQRLMCSGQVHPRAGQLQMTHPDFALLDSAGAPLHTGRLVPQYALTQGIGQHWLRRLIHDTLACLEPALGETLPPELIARRSLCGRAQALRGIHFPEDPADRDAAQRRLVYEELLVVQLLMAGRRHARSLRPGIRLHKPGDLTTRLVAALPYTLTPAQRRVAREILTDLQSGRVMHRLLQGDVGAGKTVVALIAALFVIEQGHQAMLLAPTEVLASQHGATLSGLVTPLGVTVATLTGSTGERERRGILQGLARREIDLLIGTHAILRDDVHLPGLGLVIVDEQHRFGVLQRSQAATSGGEGTPHVLVMSATPIPRSLALTLYGDLDLSLLDELPPGRAPVATRLVAVGKEAEVHNWLAERLAAGQQGYVIFPVIAETERRDLRAAEQEHERLAAGPLRAARTALLHGRLKPREKLAVMTAFAAGEIDLLVATTVVEVGVDVANASIMLIHHPERYGLAQLHQLRGRVGRGAAKSVCCLLMEPWLAPQTRQRLEYFAANHDGFRLAEEDLRSRGPGDLLGVRQHGLPSFRLANPLRDKDLLRDCAADAAELLAGNPELSGDAGRRLQEMLRAAEMSFSPLTAAG